MSDDNLEALRKVRIEAKRLNLAAATVSDPEAAILHVAFDRVVSQRMSVAEAVLLGGLSAVQ